MPKKAPIDDLADLDASVQAKREELRFSVGQSGRIRIEPESDPKRGSFISTDVNGKTQTISNIDATEAKSIITALTAIHGL